MEHVGAVLAESHRAVEPRDELRPQVPGFTLLDPTPHGVVHHSPVQGDFARLSKVICFAAAPRRSSRPNGGVRGCELLPRVLVGDAKRQTGPGLDRYPQLTGRSMGRGKSKVVPTLTALASAGGTAVVSVMATDGREGFRTGVGALWGRFRPNSTAERELYTSRKALLETPDSQTELTRQALHSTWQGRMLPPFLVSKDAAAEFRTLLFQDAKDVQPGTDIKLHPGARDHGRACQAGSNQCISER